MREAKERRNERKRITGKREREGHEPKKIGGDRREKKQEEKGNKGE